MNTRFWGSRIAQSFLKEELGVEIDLIKFLFFTNHIINSENQHWVTMSYLGKIIKGEPQNLEPHKIEEIKWFSLDNLPENINQPTKDSVKEYLMIKQGNNNLTFSPGLFLGFLFF